MASEDTIAGSTNASARHPLDRDTPDVPVRARRSLAADRPLLMRVGIITFIVGMLNAILFGVAAEIFTQEAIILDNFRRVGLGIMLVGMGLILWCFPNARRTISYPVKMWQMIPFLGPAGGLVIAYCLGILLFLPLAFVACYLRIITWLIFLALPYATMLLVWCIWAPRASRPFFVGALLSSVVLLPIWFAEFGRPAWYYYRYGGNDFELESAIMLSAALFGTIVCGCAGLFAYWIGKKFEESGKTE